MPDRTNEEEPENIGRRNVSPGDKFPPELSFWQKVSLWVARGVMGAGVLYVIYVCFQIFFPPGVPPRCTFCTYLALAGFLSGLVSESVIRHRIFVHAARKEDLSVVEALIQEAKNIDPELIKTENSTSRDGKSKKIKEEVSRLEGLGSEGWTEFQILTLNRLLIDFLPIEDLKARARSGLDELKEYADGDAFSYDVRLYYSWEEKITSNIDEVERENENQQDEKNRVEALRANLRSLREHVADYEYNWAQGSTIVSSIRICGSAGVVVFTLMGILPILYSIPDSTHSYEFSLSVLNWGYLGVAGSIASALIGLRNSNEVEVGSTFGKQELWRMVLGAPLGLLAGILIFSALAGELIKSGAIVPDLSKPGLLSAGLSVVWAVVAGMGFERLFQRMRGAVEF